MTDFSLGMNTSRESPAATFNGYVMLLVLLALIVGFFAWGSQLGPQEPSFGMVVPMPLFILAAVFVLFGFFMIQPNQGRVITLFGDYRGTERQTGLRWVWPWMGRKKISLRANNIHSDRKSVV